MDKSNGKEVINAASDAASEPKEPVAAASKEKGTLSKQLDDYKESLQRLQAEFENYKKRVEKEKLQFRQFAAAEIVKSFLPVLDSFELALKSVNAGGSGNDEKVIKGLELLYAQFYSALESQGLRPIKAVGEKLDPYRHEVLMQEATSDSGKDGVVVEEFQKGYALNGVILRYSKVKVLKFAGINDDKNNVSGGK
ncbi:nucleotide exchange factor GrpE [Candidatus Woesearchaeota archaeon]|nr:nucleotide exchange factor GrpE [Candidatus Woesearchaeota archaeon]